MAIVYDNITPSSVYWGSSEVKKLYAGGKQIYPVIPDADMVQYRFNKDVSYERILIGSSVYRFGELQEYNDWVSIYVREGGLTFDGYVCDGPNQCNGNYYIRNGQLFRGADLASEDDDWDSFFDLGLDIVRKKDGSVWSVSMDSQSGENFYITKKILDTCDTIECRVGIDILNAVGFLTRYNREFLPIVVVDNVPKKNTGDGFKNFLTGEFDVVSGGVGSGYIDLHPLEGKTEMLPWIKTEDGGDYFYYAMAIRNGTLYAINEYGNTVFTIPGVWTDVIGVCGQYATHYISATRVEDSELDYKWGNVYPLGSPSLRYAFGIRNGILYSIDAYGNIRQMDNRTNWRRFLSAGYIEDRFGVIWYSYDNWQTVTKVGDTNNA